MSESDQTRLKTDATGCKRGVATSRGQTVWRSGMSTSQNLNIMFNKTNSERHQQPDAARTSGTLSPDQSWELDDAVGGRGGVRRDGGG